MAEKKKFETPDRIKPKTLLIASLTAITVALISTRLTSTLNSLTLVGMASLLTAFVSEGYRIFLEQFNFAVRKSVDRVLKRKALALGDTGELRLVEEPLLVEETQGRSQNVARPREPGKFRRLLTSRFGMALWFGFIGIATVASSFAVSSLQEEPTVSISRNIVQQKDISQKTQKELEKKAEEAASTEAAEARAEAEKNSQLLVDLTREELVAIIEDLRLETEALTKLNAGQVATTEELLEDLTQLTATIEVLEKRIEELEKAEPPAPVEPTPTDPESAP